MSPSLSVSEISPTPTRLRVFTMTMSSLNFHTPNLPPTLKAFKVKRVGYVPGDSACLDPIINPMNMVYALMSEINVFEVQGFTHSSMNPRPKTGYIVVPSKHCPAVKAFLESDEPIIHVQFGDDSDPDYLPFSVEPLNEPGAAPFRATPAGHQRSMWFDVSVSHQAVVYLPGARSQLHAFVKSIGLRDPKVRQLMCTEGAGKFELHVTFVDLDHTRPDVTWASIDWFTFRFGGNGGGIPITIGPAGHKFVDRVYIIRVANAIVRKAQLQKFCLHSRDFNCNCIENYRAAKIRRTNKRIPPRPPSSAEVASKIAKQRAHRIAKAAANEAAQALGTMSLPKGDTPHSSQAMSPTASSGIPGTSAPYSPAGSNAGAP
uniref:Uncharacterized protein n=1 Tax=Chrysotila carterae TaxID=13221 RepID=A0A7S4C2G4_CHRCT|mmetsp:Transcript_44668/g.97264  ORF Transcript_44668/g.97264 Transcript_44668/m.97264 type:complete len:374 (+) Transcript_44668:637-1758(+)